MLLSFVISLPSSVLPYLRLRDNRKRVESSQVDSGTIPPVTAPEENYDVRREGNLSGIVYGNHM